jgi:dTDP-4-dehydrorhamnose reductase
MSDTNERVLITGAGGQLAAAMVAEYAGHAEVSALGHVDLDITRADAVQRVVKSLRPAIIINCAAYNLVDQAEEDPETALNVNAFGVKVLARAAADADATFVHYGTDFVFDGEGSRPYTEEDAPNPLSVYGTSKLLGEWFALEVPRGFVLRVASLFGGALAKSSVDRIIDALVEGRDARVFSDRTATPSYVVDVAAATRELLERGAPGLYHCVGTGYCTWQELGIAVAEVLGCNAANVVPVKTSDVALRAARPRYAALSNAKLTAITPIPTWRNALERYIATRASTNDPAARGGTLPSSQRLPR